MDHMYAATSSLSGDNVEITPPPALAPYLLDHSFARPPSECPQAASSSHGETQSPKTRSSTSKSLLLSETTNLSKQEQPVKTWKSTSKPQPLEAEMTVEQEEPRRTRKSLVKQDQPLEIEVTVAQEQTRKRRKSAMKHDQSLEAEVASEDDQPAKKKKSSTKQEQLMETKAIVAQEEEEVKSRKIATRGNQANTSNLTTKQPSGTRRIDLRQQEQTTANTSTASKQGKSPVTRRDSKHDQMKKTETVDCKKGQPPETEKLPSSQQTKPSSNIATKEDLPETRKVSSESEDSVRNTRNSAAKQDQTFEKLLKSPKTAIYEDKIVESGKTAAEEDGSEDTKILSNGKNVDLPEAVDSPVVKMKRGRPPKSFRKNYVQNVVPATASKSVKAVTDVPSDSTLPNTGASLSAPPQGKDTVTFCEPEKVDEHSVLVNSSSQEDRIPSETASDVKKALDTKDEETADSVVNKASSPVKETSRCDTGGTSTCGTNSVLRRYQSAWFVSSDDSNNNTSSLLQQEETKSPDSPQHSLCPSSAEPMDTDKSDDEKTSSGSKEAEDTNETSKIHYVVADEAGDKNQSSGGLESINRTDSGGKMCLNDHFEKQSTKPNSGDAVDADNQKPNCTEVQNQPEHSEKTDGAHVEDSSIEGASTFSTDRETSDGEGTVQPSSSVDQSARAAKDGEKGDTTEDSSTQNQNSVDTTGQIETPVSISEENNLGSLALRNICAAVRLTPKVPHADSGEGEARKRTAGEAGLDDSLSSSQLSDRSPFSTPSLMSILSSSSLTDSPASRGSQKSASKRKASIPKADESPAVLEKFRIALRDHGWRRELVVRGTYDDIKCKFPPADVYYFTPKGKKLRSGVQMLSHLKEHPSALTPDNFTFMKKSIYEEPWETVRNAGKGGLPKKSPSASLLRGSTSPKKVVKIKITKKLSDLPKKHPSSSNVASPSPSLARSASNVASPSPSLARSSSNVASPSPSLARSASNIASPSPSLARSASNVASPSPSLARSASLARDKFKPSYLAFRDHGSDIEVETDDEDYCPWKEETSPDWKKRRTFSDVRKHKTNKLLARTSPEREVLIQSIPEPEIIIDHADESLYSEDGKMNEDLDGEEDQSTDAETKPARMMLLPGDIKEESGDSEGEGRDAGKSSASNLGTVHLHISPRKPFKPHTKPTARKSTMPRTTLRKMLSQPKPPNYVPPGEGQLCSNACPGLNGVAPSVQCSVCMCLFHHVCVNLNPKLAMPGTFKCLRCRNVATSQPVTFGLTDKQTPIPPATTHVTSSFSVPICGVSVMPPKVILLRSPFPAQTLGAPAPLQTLPSPLLTSPLLTTVPTPLLPGALDGKMDASQLLKSLTTFSQTMLPITTAPIQVRPAPMGPPQLVRGGVTPSTVRPVSYCLIPPFQTRPPPRLTAAPGVVLSPALPPTLPQVHPPLHPALTILPTSSLPVVSGGVQPQSQMITLPASILTRLNLNQPLALKVNNSHVVVPPSCLITSKDGLKVLLPPSTFPIPKANTKLSLTLSNNNLVTTTAPSPIIYPSPAGLDTKAMSTASTATALTSQGISGAAKIPPAKTSAAPSQSNVVENRTSPELVLLSEDSNASDSSFPSTPDTSVGKSPGDGGSGGNVKPCRSKRRFDFTRCTIHQLYGGFDCMLAIFKYLSIPDLLRAGQVCRTWQKIGQERCLWQKVNLKGLRVKSWRQAAHFLNSVRTRNLTLQKIQPESDHQSERMKFWDSLKDCVNTLTELRHLDFGLVPAYVLHSITETLVDLQELRAQHISDFSNDEMWTTETKLDMGRFGMLSELRELRLRGVSSLALPSFSFSGTLSELACLKHLQTLSLTSVRALRDSEFSFLRDMPQLRVLELGDCFQWTEETYGVLGELYNLEHLRLECGGEIPDCGLGDALSKLPKLERLELILFTIPYSLGSALHQLTQLNTLVLWPNLYQGLPPAVVNSHTVTAVKRLKQLTCLEWGVVARPSTQASPGSKLPFRPATIPMLRRGATLNPEVEPAADDVMEVSINDFTQMLLTSLPGTTSIKVFNTQVVGREFV
ncbi:hypothetical protein ACOMHN_040464 [Nucella lapillus]